MQSDASCGIVDDDQWSSGSNTGDKQFYRNGSKLQNTAEQQ